MMMMMMKNVIMFVIIDLNVDAVSKMIAFILVYITFVPKNINVKMVVSANLVMLIQIVVMYVIIKDCVMNVKLQEKQILVLPK